jgi:NDP-sugar pyrophosphorylase family protein
MGELTADVPKPMLPVRGKPMLEHVLDRLSEAGVQRFLVVIGFKREVIRKHFLNSRYQIEYRVQHNPDGTGSAAKLAHDFLETNAFILTFGDILVDPRAYERCAQVMEDYPDTAAVLGVNDMEDPWRAAAVYADREGRMTRVIEKPPKGTSTTRWGSAGLYAMRPVAFEYLKRLQPSARNEFELTSIFEMMLADGLELRIAPVEGEWRDVGTPEDLQSANAKR